MMQGAKITVLLTEKKRRFVAPVPAEAISPVLTGNCIERGEARQRRMRKEKQKERGESVG